MISRSAILNHFEKERGFFLCDNNIQFLTLVVCKMQS